MGLLIIQRLGPVVYFLAVRRSDWDRGFAIEFEVTKFHVEHVHRCYESLNIGDYVHLEKPRNASLRYQVTRKNVQSVLRHPLWSGKSRQWGLWG